MGFAKRLSSWAFGRPSQNNTNKSDSVVRRCHFEIMEPRRVLSADPVVVGVTYLEGDLGADSTPDHFEVTFQGGSPTTQLTSFTISGDKDLSGTLSDGDMFFDFAPGGPGAGQSHPFIFDAAASRGVTAAEIEYVRMGTDGLSLTVGIRNFEAGDKLAFTIDVDEIEGLRTDKIASGVEFEGSQFSTTFVDQHYTFRSLDISAIARVDNQFNQEQHSGIFYDYYDELIAEGGRIAGQDLDVRGNEDFNQGDRSTGSIDVFELIPKPVTISGTVYHDENLNCELDADENGIANVTLNLQKLNTQNGRYEQVASTQTNAVGDYEFGTNLNLLPGTYRVVEVQPAGFLDVSASYGTVEGVSIGSVAENAQGDKNVLTDIVIPLGGNEAINYDFKEVRPASIAGTVWHDRNDNGRIDSSEEGIANVEIQVTRVSAKDTSIADPFADSAPIFLRTDANGHYSVTGLPPGIYAVVEINNYPPNANPLAPYIDGKDSVGNVRGETIGTGLNDRVNQITLCAGDAGVEYNFGELKPSSINGYVSVSTPDGNCVDPAAPGHEGIAGVTMRLLDSNGAIVATTTTNNDGFYEFTGLRNGTYSVVEVQPNAYLDGAETVGTINGASVGQATQNDRFQGITLGSGQAGVMYNFCEHIPAEICGTVWHDRNDDGVNDSGEQKIGGVVIQLFNASGNKIAETRTAADGKYCFKNLYAGTYTVKEIQPAGFADGKDSLGSVGGIKVGDMVNDQFKNITIKGGDQGTNYDFGEIRLASIAGMVYSDINGNCVYEAGIGDKPIANVTILLLDSTGAEIDRTSTDADGNYIFEGLRPGTYSVRELTPTGYLDGGEFAGKIGTVTVGSVTNDQISGIQLLSGDGATKYDFCEHPPAQISGYVFLDYNGDCVFDSGTNEQMLSGIKIDLLDANGNLLETTTTNSAGFYKFDGLMPGKYSIREQQPTEYFDLGAKTGTDTNGGVANGETTVKNLIKSIDVQGGQRLVNYNFCECPGSEIQGRVWQDGPAFVTEGGVLPSNYRSQRDGIFNAGDTPIAGVTLRLYYYIDPTSGNLFPRAVTLADVLPGHYNLGTNSTTRITVVTDANGNYSFTGIKAGNYIVVQEQPNGYIDANDVVGSTTGFSYNSQTEAFTALSAVLETFSVRQVMDSVVNIAVTPGGISVQNNFTEVVVEALPTTPRIPFLPPITPQLPPSTPTPPSSPGAFYGGLAGSQPGIYTRFIGTSRGAAFQMEASGGEPFSWHLSVVNAGQPRAAGEADPNQPQWLQAAFLNANDWTRFDMTKAGWSFANRLGDNIEELDETSVFGTFDGTPLAGDFDGDGLDEVAVYQDGYWMIDLNHNGAWDQYDLLARLGDTEDSPVVGDWDGDGKDDIGIYGPIWEMDPDAINREPGLPNPDNRPDTKAKNIPPNGGDGTSGARVMKLTAYGKQRADVIDHVFGTDNHRLVPVTGDWNGNGIRSIGTFASGSWRMDVNGDGQFDNQDSYATYGREGDIPLVGDFDGDGVEQIAVYRAGTWIIDSNDNKIMDDNDQQIRYGDSNAKPVVGDWNGDGVDDIGLYRSGQTQVDILPQ